MVVNNLLYTTLPKQNLCILKKRIHGNQALKIITSPILRSTFFKNAKPVSDIVSPGETIFVPKGWWHTARSLEPTISIAQDLLTKYNWDLFEKDVLFYKKKEGFVKGLAYGMYLKYALAGIWFNETFGSYKE